MMSAILRDVVEERITPQVARAAVAAGAQMLKVVELQLRYGMSSTLEMVDQKKRLEMVDQEEK
jgi:hypothetical protein